jgi:ribosome-associated translation inhibitor RaiA
MNISQKNSESNENRSNSHTFNDEDGFSSNIEVTLRGIKSDDLLWQFIGQHVTTPIRRIYDRQGATLDIDISDMNGDKGGPDKRCNIRFCMPHLAPISVIETSSNTFKAIAKASKRLQRRVLENKRRMTERNRHPKKYYIAKLANHGYGASETRHLGKIPGPDESWVAEES